MRLELPAGTVTFLFTDVEGSTRLLRELGAAGYAAALLEHRRLLRASFARHGGVEVDTQGDAFFVAFPTAPGALAAAAELTAALAEGPVRVRVGLHTGTPLVTGEGYVGEDVHRAARIAAAGHGGQVLVSPATARLADGAALASLGLHRLKDFETDVELFQLGGGRFPPLKTIAPTNLPSPASSFLGRVEELEELARLLRSHRLVTVTGPGGTGKTRLAIELARLSRDLYPGGTFFVPLAELRDPSLVLPELAGRLGVREAGDGLVGALAERLSGPETLVVIDNVEHVIDCAAPLSGLVRAAATGTFLVTSRETLRVDGEAVYDLAPLVAAEAVALFVERAGPAAPTGAEPAAIGELCERLDCLPLAVELAAARLGLFTSEQLLDRLGGALDLLQGGRDADPRQRTLRATIEWSHGLLDDREQRLFRRLAAFAGGCTLEAAEEVAGADPSTLQSLLDKSLLRRRDAASGPRFWMLETIRELAVERLAEAGEAKQLAARHLAWHAALAERIGEPVRDSDRAALARVDDEHADLVLALDRAVDVDDVERACDLLLPLWWYWLVRGRLAEGQLWAERLVARFHEPSKALGIILMCAGEVARFSGRFEQAIELKRRAIDVFAAGAYDPWNLAAVYTDLAEVLVAVDDEAGARESAERGLELRRELGDPVGIAHAENPFVLLALRNGRDEEALELATHAATAWRAIESWTDVADAVGHRATALRRLGRLPEAAEALREALGLAGELADESTLPALLEEAAAIALATGDRDAAATFAAAAAAMRAASGLAPYDPREHRELLAGVAPNGELPPPPERGEVLALAEATLRRVARTARLPKH